MNSKINKHRLKNWIVFSIYLYFVQYATKKLIILIAITPNHIKINIIVSLTIQKLAFIA